MKKTSAAAARYAKALFDLAKESGKTEHVLNDLRTLDNALASDEAIEHAFSSPLINSVELGKTVGQAVQASGISSEVVDTLQLLGKKKRLGLLRDVVKAFEVESDRDAGVARGTVQSPAPLDNEERRQIETFISKMTKKKAILEYKQSPELIGGLVAQVGSYVFDDSLDTQLDLLRGHLNRSGH